MENLELMKIALKYREKSYDCEQLSDGDDLYDATEEEKETCIEYWEEIGRIGEIAFKNKIDKQ